MGIKLIQELRNPCWVKSRDTFVKIDTSTLEGRLLMAAIKKIQDDNKGSVNLMKELYSAQQEMFDLIP